jgi:hypothetical protein
MRRFIEKLRGLRDNKRGSLPVQYALVAGLTALVATTVGQQQDHRQDQRRDVGPEQDPVLTA